MGSSSAEAALGRAALGLVTAAHSDMSHAELLELAVEQLAVIPDETLSGFLYRQAQLIAMLATFAATMLDVVDAVNPEARSAAETAMRNLALKWATQ